MNRCKIFAAPSNGLWNGSVPRRIGSKADTEQSGSASLNRRFSFGGELEERLQRARAASIFS
jgi:hypothetical protein